METALADRAKYAISYTEVREDALQKFVILSMPRTGSSMLVHRLDAHPHAICYPALFSRLGFADPRYPTSENLVGLDQKWQDFDARRVAHAEFLSEVIGLSPIRPAFGFKQHLTGPEEVTRSMLADPAFLKIYIKRPNLLASYSSGKIAITTGQGLVLQGEDVILAKVKFIAAEMEAHIRKRIAISAQWDAAIAATGAMEVSYPEAASRSVANDIYRFVGLDPARGGIIKTRRRQPSNILLRFSNPRDTRRWLEENRRESWAIETPPRLDEAST